MKSIIAVDPFTAVWIVCSLSLYVMAAPQFDHCTITYGVMACNRAIPDIVPSHIHSVKLWNIHVQIIDTIKSSNWTHIDSLTIECVVFGNEDETYLFIIDNLVFTNFSNLRYLKVSCNYLSGISADTFHGLVNLAVLNLSDCVRFRISSLTEALKDKLPSLQQLILRRVGLYLTDILVYSREFFESLKAKDIRHLDISGTKYGSMHLVAFAECLSSLVEFNVSEGGFLAVNLVKVLYDYPTSMMNLKSVDVSYPTLTDTFTNPSNNEYWIFKSPPPPSYVQNFTTICVRGLLRSGTRSRLFGQTFASKICAIIEMIPLNIKLITFCLLLENNTTYLENLNFAHNGLEDVDLSLTSSAVHLSRVDLSHNRLHSMPPERMESCLQVLQNLQEIYLSYNLIMNLPYGIFSRTPRLTVIDLSFNNLNTLTFKIVHLENLRELRLNNNNIKTIPIDVVKTFDKLINVRSLKSVEIDSQIESVIVDVRDNPFGCTCDNKDFVEWLINKSEVVFNDICSLKGDPDNIQREALSQINFNCNLPIFIGLFSVGGTVLFIVIAIVFVFCLRRIKRMQTKLRLQQVIEKYKVHSSEQRYPVFLSFCSVNEEFVMSHVLDELNSRLKSLLHTDKNCVATGDTTFRPGFYIAEEMVKWMEQSEVVVMCISKGFCRSPWCKDEVILSHYHHKPTILMFLEEVKTSEMPKVLRTMFGNVTRSMWKTEGEDVKLTPGWDTLCAAILELMPSDGTDSAV